MQYNNIVGQRQHLSLSSAIKFIPNQTIDEVNMTIPFIDKCGFVSIFVSCIYDLLIHFENKLHIDQLLEIMLPIGWISTGINYYRVIKKLQHSTLPTSNLSMTIIKDLLRYNEKFIFDDILESKKKCYNIILYR